MIKLVLTDIDGTLMNSQGEVSERNLTAIKNLKERGFLFGVASGRNHQDLESNFPPELAAALDVVVGENGYRVKDYSDGEELLGTPVDSARVAAIMDYFKKFHVSLIALDAKSVLAAGNTDLLDAYIAATHSSWQYEHLSNAAFSRHSLSKLTYFVRDADVPAFSEMTKQLSVKNILGVQTAYNCFEFQDVTTTKANGIAHYIAKHHIKKEEVCAMGDGENDLEMIEYVGLGIAMQNAHPKLKAAADQVCKYTCDEDGVAHILDSL